MDKIVLSRPYKEGDEKEIVEVLEYGFNGWPPFDITCSKIEHWKWKYLESPYAQENILIVATYDRKIIGSTLCYRNKVWVKNNTFVSQYGSDLAVHPDYRRIGAWDSMRKAQHSKLKNDGTEIAYWTSSNPTIIERAIKRGRPMFPHSILNMARINDFDLHLSKTEAEKILVKKTGFKILKLMNETKRILRIRFSSENNLGMDNKIKTIKKFNGKINDFYKSIRHKYNFIVERSLAYLNWRYCDPRAGNYLVRVFQEDDEILGYCVLRINKTKLDYPMGKIVDVLTSNPDITEALIRDAIGFFEEHSINHIGAWTVKSSQHEKMLSKYGFLDMKNDLRLFARSPNNSVDFEPIINSKPDQVHFQYGDTDNI